MFRSFSIGKSENRKIGKIRKSDSLKTMAKKECTKRLSLKKLIKLLRDLFIIRENRTAFVDAQFGNDQTAELNSPARSYQTIQAAITAIGAADSIRNPPWQVLVAPGVYAGLITVPAGINLVGSGSSTILQQITVNGASQISNLQLAGPTLPLINVSFNGQDINGLIRLFNVNINIVTSLTGQPVIVFGIASGMNGEVELVDSSIIVDFGGVTSSDATNIVLQSNGVVARVIDTNFELMASYQPKTIFMQDTDNQLRIQGGSVSIVIGNKAPEQDVIIFDAHGGYIIVESHDVLAIEAIVGGAGGVSAAKDRKLAELNQLHTIQEVVPKDINQDVGNMIYANASNAGLIKISDTAVDFGGVPAFIRYLANVADQSSRVTLLNVKTFSTFVFPVSGFTRNISYFAVSELASITTNGGLNTNIINVNTTNVGGDFYPVQDNDYTVLVSDPPVASVGLADPTIASQSVIYKGKIVVVKNISTSTVQVVAQNDAIFDGTQTLLPGQFRQFQNDGIKWYVI
jgi:hypothetical protein